MSKKQKGMIAVPGRTLHGAPSPTTTCNKPKSFKRAFLEPCEIGSPWPELRPEDLTIEAYSDSIRQPLGTQKRCGFRVSASRRMLWVLLLLVAIGGYAAAPHDRDFLKAIVNWLLRTLK